MNFNLGRYCCAELLLLPDAVPDEPLDGVEADSVELESALEDEDVDDDSLLLELELDELLELELELDELLELEEDLLLELELRESLTSVELLAAVLPLTNSSELLVPSTETVFRNTVSGLVQLVLETFWFWYT